MKKKEGKIKKIKGLHILWECKYDGCASGILTKREFLENHSQDNLDEILSGETFESNSNNYWLEGKGILKEVSPK